MIHVGIDIDGVMRDFGHQFAKYAKRQYGITIQPSDYEQFGFSTVQFDGRKIIQDVFANPTVGQFVFEEAPIIENAKTGYKMFTEHPGIRTYVVSTQKKDYEPFSNRWMENNKLTSHTKTFYERNKLNAPVQILIDDKPDHINKYLKNGRDAVLINQPYNRGVNFDVPVTRADDLIDAYKHLTQKYAKFI